MSLHRLSAGGGYEYLLRHTACGDVERAADTPLTAYYTASGYPPGRWLGAGLAGLANGAGTAAGSPVGEEGMARLYGAGCDPVTGAELGARYRVYRTLRERVAARAAALPAGLDPDDPAEAVARVEAAEAVRRTPVAVAGFDLTFTAPKSVSVLWALADPALQEQLIAAHRAAVADALALLEAHALFTRVGKAGAAQVSTRGAIAAAFEHWDTRTGDPNLHTHLVLANKVQGLDGRWRSLDSKALHAATVAVSEVYDVLLADRVTAVAGVNWEERDRGSHRSPGFEITSVPDRLLAAFSSRSAAIGEALQGLVAGFTARHGRTPGRAEVLRLRQHATRVTRPGKTLHPLPDLLDRWRTQARQVLGASGETDALAQTLANAAASRSARLPTVADLDAATMNALAAATVTGVQARRATWTRWNLLAEAARATHHLRLVSVGERLELLDRVVDTAIAHCLVLDPPALVDPPAAFRRPDGESAFARHWETAYTSPALLDAETRLLAAAANTSGPRALAEPATEPPVDVPEPVPDPLPRPLPTPSPSPAGAPRLPTPRRGLPSSADAVVPLSGDQAAAVSALATSGRRVDVLVGPAGAGKTTTLRALRAVWEATHGPGSVIALAPSASAAAELSAALGIACDTLAKWDHETSRGADWAPRSGQLLLVDEASLAGTILLDRVASQALAAGAKLLLIGDHHQLSAVDAGGAFGLLAREASAAELTALWRFRYRWEAEATRALRRGDLAALDAYVSRGRLHDGPAEAVMEAAYRASTAARQSGRRALLLAPDTATVAALNTRSRTDRIAAGEVELDGAHLHDGACAGVGDVVVTRRNERRLRSGSGADSFVRNGDLWTVVARHQDGSLTVHRAQSSAGGVGRVRLPAAYVQEHVELGYATTVHRAQGLTVDAAFAIVRPGMSRETAYVALTRGREANHAFVITDAPDPDCDRIAPAERTGCAVLAAVLARSDADLSATETLHRRQDEAGSLARLAPIHATLTQAAQSRRWAAVLRGDSTLLDRDVTAIVESPAFGALVAALRDGERKDHQMTAVLSRLAVTDRPNLEDARDRAAVLQAQVTTWLADPPPPVRPAMPLLAGHLVPARPLSGDREGDELIASLPELERLITDRVRELVTGVVAAPPAWARPLGPPPAAPAAAAAWTRHMGTICAYRDLYGLSDLEPLVQPHNDDEAQSQAYRRAAAASRAASDLVQHDRWAPRTTPHHHTGLDLSRAPGR